MDLDDIEIQTVEVVRTPDGSRICRIYYVKKPLAQQDPAKRAKVQFVDNTPSRNPVQASFQEPIATPLQSMAQALVRTRKAWEARPSKPRKPLLATIWECLAKCQRRGESPDGRGLRGDPPSDAFSHHKTR